MPRPTKKRDSLRKRASIQSTIKMARNLKEEARLGIKYLYYTYMEAPISLELTTEVVTSIHRFIEYVNLEPGTSFQLRMRDQYVATLRRLYPIPGEDEEIRAPNIGDEQVIPSHEREKLGTFIEGRAREFDIYPRLVAYSLSLTPSPVDPKLLVHESPNQSDDDERTGDGAT